MAIKVPGLKIQGGVVIKDAYIYVMGTTQNRIQKNIQVQLTAYRSAEARQSCKEALATIELNKAEGISINKQMLMLKNTGKANEVSVLEKRRKELIAENELMASVIKDNDNFMFENSTIILKAERYDAALDDTGAVSLAKVYEIVATLPQFEGSETV